MKSYQYQVLENKPIGCDYCGAHIQGKITKRIDTKTKETINECRWICSRCGNLSKVGIVK
jgi:hypothetical protein